MIGSQTTAQFSSDWKLNPESVPGGAMRTTLNLSLPDSRMKSLRPASTSQPSGAVVPGLATNSRSARTASPQFISAVSSTVTS